MESIVAKLEKKKISVSSLEELNDQDSARLKLHMDTVVMGFFFSETQVKEKPGCLKKKKKRNLNACFPRLSRDS